MVIQHSYAARIQYFDTRQNYSNLELKETGASVNIGKRFKFPDDYFRGDWTAKFQRTDVINGDEIYQEESEINSA